MYWLLHTSAGLRLRIIVGVTILALLAIDDLRRRGRSATRWREYAVLAVCVAVALLYGIINDQITVTISWEYFYYGKELDRVLGPAVPPDMAALRWGAAKVGMMATWSAGLIFGVALLLANNPMRSLPRMGYRRLLRIGLPIMVLSAVVCGVVGGIAGYHGWLTWCSDDFADLVQMNMYRPYHFMCTWGVHLGGYVGGLIGTIVVVAVVLQRRVNLRNRWVDSPKQ